MIYGYNDTIHGTQEVNIERNPKTGAVVAVWFRCTMLPFIDKVVDLKRVKEMKEAYRDQPPRGILAIDFSNKSPPKEYEIRGLGLHPKDVA